MPRSLDEVHGTRRGYDIERCRCTECRACNADRVRRWRAARPDGQPHPWRERLMQEFYAATHAWWLDLEARGYGHDTESDEWREFNPPPQLRDFMVALAS